MNLESAMTVYADFELKKPIRDYKYALIHRMTLKSIEGLGDFTEKFDEMASNFIVGRVELTNEQDAESGVAITVEDMDGVDFSDIMVFSNALLDMVRPDDEELGPMDVEGDGYEKAIFVPLRKPLVFGQETVTALEFLARNFGQVRNVLKTTIGAPSAREFVRAFGSVVGSKMPLSDSLLDQLDFIDVARISKYALGKFVRGGAKTLRKR